MLQGDTYTSIFKTLLSSQLEGIMDTEARETRERYVQWEKKRREDARLTAARTSKKAEMKKASDVLAKKIEQMATKKSTTGSSLAALSEN